MADKCKQQAINIAEQVEHHYNQHALALPENGVGSNMTMILRHSASEILPVISGVSILGPLLFLIYINDLPDKLSMSKILLFADDAKCLGSAAFQRLLLKVPIELHNMSDLGLALMIQRRCLYLSYILYQGVRNGPL